MPGERVFDQEPRSSAELEFDRVAEHNLTMLNNDMMYFLGTESLGGSAGSVEIAGKRYSCSSANGYADPETGWITAFGNFQDLSPEARVGARIYIRVATNLHDFLRVVDWGADENLSAEGQRAIQTALNRLNAQMKEYVPGGSNAKPSPTSSG